MPSDVTGANYIFKTEWEITNSNYWIFNYFFFFSYKIFTRQLSNESPFWTKPLIIMQKKPSTSCWCMVLIQTFIMIATKYNNAKPCSNQMYANWVPKVHSAGLHENQSHMANSCHLVILFNQIRLYTCFPQVAFHKLHINVTGYHNIRNKSLKHFFQEMV